MVTLRFGNLEDVISVKEEEIKICSREIAEIFEMMDEYEPDRTLPAEKNDPYIKQLNADIDKLEREKDIIRAEIRSLMTEIDFRRSRH